jgi:hypothetical protein
MLERRELLLKIAVGVAAGVVLYELLLFVVHINPLWRVKIPALPSLPPGASTMASSKTTNTPPVKATGSNAAPLVATAKGTNSPVTATNVTAKAGSAASHATNSLTRDTNIVATATNQLAAITNATANGTNVLTAASASARALTNSGTASNAPVSTTSSASKASLPLGGPPGMPPGMMGMGPGGGPGMPPGIMPMGLGGPGMKPGPELPPDRQARLDRIIDSEILAPVMRPLPMALLGIAGPHVFFRAPNGQTGLIKEGEELGGVKLLRIGINRVLVEEKGEQKELIIFSGFGSESLMSAKKDSPK